MVFLFLALVFYGVFLMLLTFVAILGLLVYFSLFWYPDDDIVTAPDPWAARKGSESTFQPQVATATLELDKVWYGVTLHGFCDHYTVSTTRTVDEAREAARAFFTGKRARVLIEDGHRLSFSRGKKIYKYLGGLDTWPPQEIDVIFRIEDYLTKISIHSRPTDLGKKSVGLKF